VNARLRIGNRWLEVDCLWRAQQLVVELDGRSAHATAAAFERDRARDRLLSVAGLRPVRITWRQLQNDTDALASDLGALLHPPTETLSSGATASV
jgi:very-short-patch-repair endonuclease